MQGSSRWIRQGRAALGCLALSFASLAILPGCPSTSDEPLPTLGDGSTGETGFNLDGDLDGFNVDTGDGPGGCKGLACLQVTCPAGGTTSISGTVYAPNGTLPLYNVIVYVPNGELKPVTKGVTCDRCGTVASGDPLVTTLTDASGQFKLDNMPVGKDIPVVFQLGKWRRKATIPEVKACADTKLGDPNVTRLPKNRTEGDMPQIAVTTGVADKVPCMLPKIGIDSSEFGPGGAGKAVEFYNGAQIPGYTEGKGPTGSPDVRVLWDDLAKLKIYDMVIVSCEGYEAAAPKPIGTWPITKDATSFKAMTDYLAAGGRIFTTDYEYTWYKYSPDPALAAVGVIPGGAPAGANPVDLDTTFPKGKALADWLKVVEPASPYAKLTCDYIFDNVTSVTVAAQTWARSGAPHPRFFTINTPVGKPVEAQCGKAVHLDAHINMSDHVGETFPAGCTSPLKQGEKAFAFFLFDLASCIQKEGETPKPPAIK